MNEQELLIQEIEKQEPHYNPEKYAITEPFSSPGYHTTLTTKIGNIHSTRTAAYYALALLDSGLIEYQERAFNVLMKLVGAQDVNPNHKTFGIWSWFYEESLEQMSPPDWNWADFIGKPLILILKRHSNILPEELCIRVEQAVRNACEAIIRRNVGPHYTNIAIMGAFVTLVAGEWLGDRKVEDYGLARLQRFYEYTQEVGSFQEFNSPTYTMVAIEELSSIWTETRSEKGRALAEGLLTIAWDMVAKRFHPSSKQWAGPHDRSYSELLPDHVLSFLQLSLGGKVSLISEKEFSYQTMWYRNNIKCPNKLVSCFVEARESNLIQRLLVNQDGEQRYAVTYATNNYNLGTFNQGDLWNQRRNFLAYAATQQGPVYVHLRALRDGYDYTGAYLHVAQLENHALFTVSLVTDGGDRHPNLDLIKDATIVAKDLRLRFEIGGAIDKVEASWLKQDRSFPHCSISIDGLPIQIEINSAEFSSEAIRYEVERTNETVQLDIILYEGETKPIQLAELGTAIVAGQFAIDESPLLTETDMTDDIYTLQAYEENDRNKRTLRIAVPIFPTTKRKMASLSKVSTEIYE